MFFNLVDRMTRHRATVVYDETEMLLHFCALISEELVVLQQSDVDHNLIPVGYLVVESAQVNSLVVCSFYHRIFSPKLVIQLQKRLNTLS